MQKLVRWAGLSIVSMTLLIGCNPSSPGTPASGGEGQAAGQQVQVEATPSQLVATLIEMSHTPDNYNTTPERHLYTRNLAAMGPTALSPLIDYMGAPDTDDMARLFILQCLNDILTPYYLPNLKPMISSEDQVIRAIGVTAISTIDDPAVLPLLEQARGDDRPRVAFSALSGMTMQGDTDAREEMKSLYLNNATMGDIPEEQVKREVVRALVREPQTGDLAILKDALNQPWVEVNYRAAIVRALGQMGGADDIPLLEQSLGLQKEDAYGKLVRQAIESIQERQSQA